MAALLPSVSARSVTLTWDADGTTAGQVDGAGEWTGADLWWDGANNVSWTSGSDASFGLGGAGGDVTLASPTTVNSLTFNTFTGTYTLGTAAQAMTLNNGITMNAGAGAVTVISPVTLALAQSWTNNSSSLLTVSGDITNGGNLLTITGSGNTTLSGIIGNGTGGLTKSGAGTLVLSGTNTFSGAVAVNGGTLSFGASANLGDASATNTLAIDGGTLRSTGTGFVDLTATRTLALGAGGGVIEITGANDWLQVTGTVSGSTTLSKIGPGTLSLEADNSGTFSGAVDIDNGRLNLAHASGLGTGVVTIKSGASLQVAIANAKLANVIVQSGGVLRLNQPQDTTAGATIPTSAIAGTLEINNAGVGANFDGVQMAGGSKVRSSIAGVNYTSDLTLNGAVDFDTVNQNFTVSGTLSGAGGINKVSANTLTLSGTNTFSGLVTINGGTLSVGGPANLGDASATNTIALGGGTLRSTATLDLGTTRTIAVGTGGGALSAQTGTVLTVSGALSGTGTLSAAGGGTVVLTANNTGFGGNFTVDSVSGNTTNTTLRPSSLNSLPASTIITVNPGSAASGGNGNQVELTGQSVGSGVSLVLNTLGTARSSLFASSGTNVWAGGIQFGGDGAPGLNVASGATLTINGNITAAGGGYTGTAFLRGTGTGVINGTINLPAGTFAKTDNGSWTINSTGNTWLNTTVAVGTLKLGIANAIPSTTAVTLGQNDGNSPTLDLNGFGQTIASLATNPTTGLTGTKTVTSATAATLTINGSANTTYAGVITGALSLVKSGTGTQTFTGANSYTGGITLNNGTLNINSVGTAGTNGPLGNGGTFTINGGVIDNTSGSAKVVANVNPITLGGDFAFSTSAGTANNNLTLPGAISMAADRIITLNGLGALTLSGKLINTGDSVRTLTVNNGTGTGATSLLTIGGYDLTGPGSTAPRNNIINGTGNVTISGTVADGVSAGSGLTVAGSGTLILSGANTYTGTTTINSGSVLTIQNGMALGSTVGGTSVPSGAALHIQGGAGIGAEPLALNGTGISNAGALRNISGGNSYGGLVTLGSATRINSDAGLLTWDVASGNAITGAFDLTFGGAGNISVADPIATGIGSVTKDGAGTLILSGANTYSGATTVSEGTLQFTSPNSLYSGNTGSWTAGNINVKSGATLALNVDSAGTNGFTAANLDTLLTNISVANTASEGLQAGAILALNTSTATGATFTQGSAIANSTGAFGGAIGLTKLGTGTLVLDKVNTYTGSTVINAGTVTLNRQTGSLNTGSALTFTATGTFNMDNTGAGGALTQSLGALTFSAGDGTVKTTRTAAFDQAISFASLAGRTAGATGNFVNTGTNSATNGFIFSTAPTAGALIDPGLFYNGSAYATYDAGGFVRGFGAGDTDYLEAPAGATIGSPTSSSNVAVTGAISAQTSAIANTIDLGANSITMSGASPVLQTNGLLSSGSATATIGGGTTPRLQPATAGGELVVRVNGGSDVLTITSIIENNTSASSLTKTGDGRLNLNAVNTFTGAININSGVLAYGSNSATIAGNVTIGSGATLATNSPFGQTLTFSGTILNNGIITRAANGGTVLNGVISGTGSVSNGGAGSMTLNGSNTFSGGVTQTGDGSGANTLTLGNGGALGTGTFTIASAGAVQSSVANLVNAYNNPILLNSNFTFAGSNNADLGAGAVTLSGNRTLTVSNTLTLGGVIGETGGARSLTKAGTGTLVLGGTGSTYSGGTTISAGTLRLGASDVLLNTGAVTVGGGTLDIQSFSDTIGALTLTSGSITGTTGVLTGTSYNVQSGTVSASLGGTGVAVSKTTGGTVTLSGSNTYTGATTVSAGILTFANPASLYTGNTANWTAANINVKAGGTLAVNVDSAGANGFDATNLNTLVTNISVANSAASGLQTGASIGFDTGTATGATFTLPNALADSTGAFGGPIGLAKLGAGTLVIDKANTNTGPTAIYAGTLQLDNTGVISAAPLLNNGSFVVNKSGALTQGTTFPSLMAGSGSLTYAGGGTLTLNAANSYSGNTTVGSGTLALTNALALQNSALVTTSGNVTLTGPTTLTLGGLSGATGDLASVISSGYSSVTALILNVGTGVTNTYGGVIADGATGMTLTKTGGGTQVFQGANTYTGATTVNAGTLTLSGATGSISSTSIVLSGGGLTLDNSSTSGGSLGTRVSDSAAVNVSGNSALRFFHNAAAATNYAETIGTLALQSGFLTYTGSQAATGQTSSLDFNTLSRSGTATVNFAGTGLGTNARNTITFAAGVTAGTDLGPWAVVNGADFATYDGTLGVKATTNTTLAAGSNSNTTNFRLTGGGITITASLNPSYKTLLVSDTTARTLAINGNTVSVGGISTTGQTHIISGTGAVQALAAGDPLYVNVGANTLTFSSVIRNVGAGATASAVVKSGAGTLTLGGTNTFTGSVIVNGGTLNTTTDANLGQTNANPSLAAPIVFDGSANLGTGSVTYVRGITLNNGSYVSFSSNTSSTFSGNVTGTGGIAMNSGFGSQVFLTGTSNTFEGQLRIGSTGTTGQAYRFQLASLADSTTANGRIIFSASSVTHNEGSVFEYIGTSNLTFNNRQIELASATASPTNGHQIRSNGAGSLTINTDIIVSTPVSQTLVLRGSNTASTFAGKITDGPGAVISVTKSDGGTWTLSGNNTFSGGLTLSGATANSQLNINSATALGTGPFTVSGGNNAKIDNTSGGGITLTTNNAQIWSNDFLFIGSNPLNMGIGPVTMGGNRALTVGGTLTVGGSISGAFTLTKGGGGTLVLSGQSTYTGVTNINQGILSINSLADFGSNSPLGAPTSGSIRLGSGALNGTLLYTGAGHSSNRTFQIGDGTAANLGSGTISNDGSGALILTAPSFNPVISGITATRSLTLGGTSTGFVNVIQGVIQDNNGATGKLNLVKSDASTWALAGTNTYTGATAVNAGTLRVDGSIAASSGVTVAASATFTAGVTQVVKTLDLSAASSNASILAGAIRVLSVGDNTAASPLTLTGGKMDLNTSALIVDFSAGNEVTNLADLKTAIIAGRGTGVWDGTSGLTSSAAAAASSVYGVGYAPSSIATGAIAGVTPDADAVVARYTRLGDANLDGAVNFFDLTALAAAYGGAGEWYNGDFDYSGTINFFDLTALAANYGTGLPSEAIPGATPDFSADLAAAFASVPEPGAISLLGLAALALLRRSVRRRNAA